MRAHTEFAGAGRNDHGIAFAKRNWLRALRFDDASYTTVKRILHEGLENTALPVPVPHVSPEAFAFARPVEEIFGKQVGGLTWN